MYNDNSNLAYDLSLFDVDEDYERRRAEKQKQKQNIKVAQKKAVGRNGNAFTALITVVFAACIAFALLNSKVQLADYAMMISDAKTDIEQAERENLRLKAELDSMVTLDNVEKTASEELGLQKTQNSQIEYIALNTENMTEVAVKDENIFVSIQNWFYNILEYLGF